MTNKEKKLKEDIEKLGYTMVKKTSSVLLKSNDGTMEVVIKIPKAKVEVNIKPTDKQVDLIPITDLANKVLNLYGKWLFMVSKHIMTKEDKCIGFDSWRFDNFDNAVNAFHKLEKELVEQGYDLDDNTSDSTFEDLEKCNFFNNATNKDNTVLLFLDKVFNYKR